MNCKRKQGNFTDDGNAMYLGCGVGLTDVHILSKPIRLQFFSFFFFFVFLFVVVVVAISWAAPTAYGGSQARG